MDALRNNFRQHVSLSVIGSKDLRKRFLSLICKPSDPYKLSFIELELEFNEYEKEKGTSISDFYNNHYQEFQKPLLIVYTKSDQDYNFAVEIYKNIKNDKVRANPYYFFIELFPENAHSNFNTILSYQDFESQIRDRLYICSNDPNYAQQLILYIITNFTKTVISPNINMHFPAFDVQNLVATSYDNNRTYILTSDSIKLFTSTDSNTPSQTSTFRFVNSFTFYHPTALLTNCDGTKLILVTQFSLYLIDQKYSGFNPNDIFPDLSQISPQEISFDQNIDHIVSIDFLPLYPNHLLIASHNSVFIYIIDETGPVPRFYNLKTIKTSPTDKIQSCHFVPISSRMQLSSFLRFIYIGKTEDLQGGLPLRSIVPQLTFEFGDLTAIPERFFGTLGGIKDVSISQKKAGTRFDDQEVKDKLLQHFLYKLHHRSQISKGETKPNSPDPSFVERIFFSTDQTDLLPRLIYLTHHIYQFIKGKNNNDYSILETFFLQDIWNKFKKALFDYQATLADEKDTDRAKTVASLVSNYLPLQEEIDLEFNKIPFDLDQIKLLSTGIGSPHLFSIEYHLNDIQSVTIHFDFGVVDDISKNHEQKSFLISRNIRTQKEYIIKDFSFTENNLVAYALVKEKDGYMKRHKGYALLHTDYKNVSKLEVDDLNSSIISKDEQPYVRFFYNNGLFLKTQKSLFLLKYLRLHKLIESNQILGFARKPFFCIVAPGFSVKLSEKFTRVSPAEAYPKSKLKELGIIDKFDQLKSEQEKFLKKHNTNEQSQDESDQDDVFAQAERLSEETKQSNEEARKIKEKTDELAQKIANLTNDIKTLVEKLHKSFPIYSNDEVMFLSILNVRKNQDQNTQLSQNNDDDDI